MRRTELRRHKPFPRSTHSLPSSNPERRRKVSRRRATERRETDGANGRMDTLRRDGFRCTAILDPRNEYLPLLTKFATGEDEAKGSFLRCRETDFLQEHHVGKYEDSNRVTLCRSHHEYLEGQLRWYKRGRR